MQLGMIGVGRMGGNMTLRLLAAGHECVAFALKSDKVEPLQAAGATITTTLADFIAKLRAPRAVWLMIPAAAVDGVIRDLTPLLARGDVLIDGGNSHYVDDIRRASELEALGLHYLDVGTSGGVWGRRERLLPDGRRRAGRRRAACADLRRARARRRSAGVHRAAGHKSRRHGGEQSPRQHGAAGLAALRLPRRRPLREDGPQRHRVRPHGGIRRGAEPAQARECGARRRGLWTRRRRRSSIPSYFRISSTSRRSPRYGGTEASSDRGCSTLRPRRSSATGISAASRVKLPTRARGAGRSTRRSNRACRCPCSRRRCSLASARAARTSSRTDCCRR